MAHAAYDFEVITPDGPAFRGRVRSIRLPGKTGNFGILARHAPLVAALDPGLLVLSQEGGEKGAFAVGEGFVEVRTGRVRALVDFCNRREQIDVARAEKARDRARERLRSRKEATLDFVRAEAALRRALARLSVARYSGLD